MNKISIISLTLSIGLFSVSCKDEAASNIEEVKEKAMAKGTRADGSRDYTAAFMAVSKSGMMKSKVIRKAGDLPVSEADEKASEAGEKRTEELKEMIANHPKMIAFVKSQAPKESIADADGNVDQEKAVTMFGNLGAKIQFVKETPELHKLQQEIETLEIEELMRVAKRWAASSVEEVSAAGKDAVEILDTYRP